MNRMMRQVIRTVVPALLAINGTCLTAQAQHATTPSTGMLVDSLRDLAWLAGADVDGHIDWATGIERRAELLDRGVDVVVVFHGRPGGGALDVNANGRPTPAGYVWSEEAAPIMPWVVATLRGEGFAVLRYYNPGQAASVGINVGDQLAQIIGWVDDGWDGVYIDGPLPLAGQMTDYMARVVSCEFVKEIRERAPPGWKIALHYSIYPGIGRRVGVPWVCGVPDYCRVGELPYIPDHTAGDYLEDKWGPPAPVPGGVEDPLWRLVYPRPAANGQCNVWYKPDPRGGAHVNPFFEPGDPRCRQWKIAAAMGHGNLISPSWYAGWSACMYPPTVVDEPASAVARPVTDP